MRVTAERGRLSGIFELSPEHMQIDLTNGPTAPGVARRAVAVWASEMLDVENLRSVILMVSELVSNAVKFTSGHISLSVWRCEPARWRVEVTDESALLPLVSTDIGTLRGGRGLGLQLVDSLSYMWGTIARPGGKCVWFELRNWNRVSAPGIR